MIYTNTGLVAHAKKRACRQNEIYVGRDLPPYY